MPAPTVNLSLAAISAFASKASAGTGTALNTPSGGQGMSFGQWMQQMSESAGQSGAPEGQSLPPEGKVLPGMSGQAATQAGEATPSRSEGQNQSGASTKTGAEGAGPDSQENARAQESSGTRRGQGQSQTQIEPERVRVSDTPIATGDQSSANKQQSVSNTETFYSESGRQAVNTLSATNMLSGERVELDTSDNAVPKEAGSIPTSRPTEQEASGEGRSEAAAKGGAGPERGTGDRAFDEGLKRTEEQRISGSSQSASDNESDGEATREPRINVAQFDDRQVASLMAGQRSAITEQSSVDTQPPLITAKGQSRAGQVSGERNTTSGQVKADSAPRFGAGVASASENRIERPVAEQGSRPAQSQGRQDVRPEAGVVTPVTPRSGQESTGAASANADSAARAGESAVQTPSRVEMAGDAGKAPVQGVSKELQANNQTAEQRSFAQTAGNATTNSATERSRQTGATSSSVAQGSGQNRSVESEQASAATQARVPVSNTAVGRPPEQPERKEQTVSNGQAQRVISSKGVTSDAHVDERGSAPSTMTTAEPKVAQQSVAPSSDAPEKMQSDQSEPKVETQKVAVQTLVSPLGAKPQQPVRSSRAEVSPAPEAVVQDRAVQRDNVGAVAGNTGDIARSNSVEGSVIRNESVQRSDSKERPLSTAHINAEEHASESQTVREFSPSISTPSAVDSDTRGVDEQLSGRDTAGLTGQTQPAAVGERESDQISQQDVSGASVSSVPSKDRPEVKPTSQVESAQAEQQESVVLQGRPDVGRQPSATAQMAEQQNGDADAQVSADDSVSGVVSERSLSARDTVVSRPEQSGRAPVGAGQLDVSDSQRQQANLAPQSGTRTAPDTGSPAQGAVASTTSDAESPSSAPQGGRTAPSLGGEVRQINESTASLTAQQQASTSAANPAQKAEAAAGALAMAQRLQDPVWGRAMGQRAVMMAQYGPRSAEIQLDPPELGAMQIRVHIGHGDQVSVTFTSPNAAVRDALEQQMPRLREMFSEQGLDLNQSTVSDQSTRERNDDSPDRRGGGRGGQYAGDEGAADVPATAQSVPVGLVDYYA